MTKRHFIAIARGIFAEQEQYKPNSIEWQVVKDCALQLCIAFHATNERFQQDTFLKACGF